MGNNWYIELYNAGYKKALQMLKDKYSKYTMFDYKHRTINGCKTNAKNTSPEYLQIHHDLELNFTDICKDYIGYYDYLPESNYCTNLTYCNIFEHYVLHVLIKLTPTKKISEKEMFKEYRKDLSEKEIDVMLKKKHIRMMKNKTENKFAGWSGIFKQIEQIFAIHYENKFSLSIYKKYMKAFSNTDYEKFTEFWNTLPENFKTKEQKINNYYNSKRTKELGIKDNITTNEIIDVSKCNYSQYNDSCLKNGIETQYPLFDENGIYSLIENECRTKDKNCLLLFTNNVNAEIFIKLFNKDEELLNHIKKLLNESEKLRCIFSNINNPANFIQFVREVGSMFYGYPCGTEISKNDIINFYFILPAISKDPSLLKKGSKEIRHYMLENHLPIPDTWKKPKCLSKKDSLLWDKNIFTISDKWFIEETKKFKDKNLLPFAPKK